MESSNLKRPTLPPQYWRLKPFQLIVIDLLDWLFSWVVINLLWVFLSLTIILFPPATAALFETVHAAYHNQPPNARRFLASVRRWFVKSWLWAATNLLIFAALFLAARAGFPNEIVLATLGVIAALVLVGQMYFWPYVMLQEQPELLRALRNSVFTVLGDLFYAVMYLALTLFLLVPFVIVIAPFLLIGPVLFAMLHTYGLIVWLQQHKILKDNGREL